MIALEAREDELTILLTNRPAEKPALHPNLATIYRDKVAALHDALAAPSTKDAAFGLIRGLIEEVRLVPEAGELPVEIVSVSRGPLWLNDSSCIRPRP